MSYVYDIILILVIFTFFISGMRRGFLRSIISLVGNILSIVLAGFLASYFSEWIFDIFMRPNITTKVYNVLQDTIGQDLQTRNQAIFSIFPSFVSNSLSCYGLSAQSINSSISSASQSTALQVVNAIAPIIVNFMRTIIFTILVILLSFVVRRITWMVGRIARLPILKQIDQLLGGFLGLIKCALFIFVFCTIIYIMVPMLENTPELLSRKTINATYVFKYFYYSNPLNSMLKTLA